MGVRHATAPTGAPIRSGSGAGNARTAQGALVSWLNWLAPLLLGMLVVAAFLGDPAPAAHGAGLGVALGVVAFVVGVLGRNVTTARCSAIHIGFIALAVAGATALVVLQPNGPGSAGMLVAVLFVARLLPVRAAVGLLVVTFTAAVAAAWATGRDDIAVLVALGVFYGLIYLAFRLRQANAEAARLLAELAHSQEVRARAAGLAERARVAREIHDVLAHSLSGLVLQLEASRMLLARDPVDPRLAAALDRAHQLGRQGLDEARRAIGTLRDADLPNRDGLVDLATAWEQDHAASCHVEITGEHADLDAEAGLAVYRVAQEALTNAARHAPGDLVTMRLDHHVDSVRLTVETTHPPGSPAPSPPRGPAPAPAGHGLTGMRERAELLGGTLEAGPTARGFRVRLELPR
jgi:signal transduction histidine kinase